ncbi:hypothetical protein TNCV_4049601 [Trichonephila clavipes]|nr:hypothetical protein TNCV_4049601 [Trichonephila clavipes]
MKWLALLQAPLSNPLPVGSEEKQRAMTRTIEAARADVENAIEADEHGQSGVGGSLPQINLGVQGVTQGGHHTPALDGEKGHMERTGFRRERPGMEEKARTATAGSDVVQSGRPIFDDFFQHLWPYIGNNTANVVFQMVKRLWLIRKSL